MYLLETALSSFCSRRIAPTSRVIASSLGKMPTTLVRRLIAPLRRSSGLVECNFWRCSLGKWNGRLPETLDSIRDAEGVPHEAVSASVSLDGVMVPLRAGEDGRAEASWREAACGTVSFHDARGERLKTLYLGRMPESGKVTLKAQLASEVAHIRQLRPDVRIVAIADGAADNWTFLETLSPETEVIDFWHACEHLRTASDHAVASDWFERYREVLRHDPCGVDKVIRALRHFRDSAKPDRAEIERELAFFRKHRQRMRYHALKAEGVAIGSGVVEAANGFGAWT